MSPPTMAGDQTQQSPCCSGTLKHETESRRAGPPGTASTRQRMWDRWAGGAAEQGRAAPRTLRVHRTDQGDSDSTEPSSCPPAPRASTAGFSASIKLNFRCMKPLSMGLGARGSPVPPQRLVYLPRGWQQHGAAITLKDEMTFAG